MSAEEQVERPRPAASDVLARVAAADLARRASGDLAPERLALAAYLCDPAACAGTGRARTAGPDGLKRLARWCRGLRRFGPEAVVRAAVAVARRAAEDADAEGDLELEPLLGAAEAWMACPCDGHVESARRRAQDGLEDVARGFGAAATLGQARRRAWALEAAFQAATAVANANANANAAEPRAAVNALVRAVRAAGSGLPTREGDGWAGLFLTVRDALLPWALASSRP